MIDILAWLATFVAAVTGMAMLHDSSARPADTSPRGWLRHVLRLTCLICITASACVVCAMPSMRTASVYEVVLRAFLAAYMAMQSPCPWFRYVFQGRATGFFDRRRVL